MKHTVIFIVFFLTFTCASILISTPTLPGTLFINLFSRTQLAEYSTYLAAVINGLVYSLLLSWVFVWISEKLIRD